MRRLGVALGAVAAAALVGYAAAYRHFHPGSLPETCRGLAAWGAGGRPERPMQLAWSAGRLLVADAEQGAVEAYRPDGSLVSRWTGFRRPVAVAVAGRAVFVADFLADQVVKLSPDGTVLARWGRPGTGPGEFDAPAGVAVDAAGDVYVSDFYNHRVQRFDAAGRFLGQWGGEGRTRGRFRYPAGLAVGGGEVFVADAFNHRVQVFTPEGGYRRQWGGVGFGFGGSWPGWFRLAKEVALDAAGRVYVVDAFNGRLQKFTPEGRLLAIFHPADPGLAYPSGVAVGADGTVWVSDFRAGRVRALRCE